MTASWIAFGLVVGFLVAAAAWALDGVCRIAGRPVRWTWAGALVLTVVLVGLAPLRRVSVPAPVPLSLDIVTVESFEMATPAPPDLAASLLAFRRAVGATLTSSVAMISRYVPASLDAWFAAGWIALSTFLLGLYALVLSRFRRLQRGWPAVELLGARVRVAPHGGPLVAGLSRSEIVIPRWLLQYGPEEQRLVIAHETEHVRARDPLLLAVSCAVAALLPWHPAVWWMLARVRLGVELDCDMRVLRRGVSARAYGELLVDLAGRYRGLPLGVPALAAKSSHLRQRLLAMKTRHLRFAGARLGALAIFALGVLLAACAARVPAVENPPAEVAQVTTDTVTVVRADSATRQLPSLDTATLSRARESVRDSVPAVSIAVSGMPAKRAFVVLDGVRLGMTTLDSIKGIDPGSIENVEVLKGSLAASLYGADAESGVIIINTKRNQGANPASPESGERASETGWFSVREPNIAPHGLWNEFYVGGAPGTPGPPPDSTKPAPGSERWTRNVRWYSIGGPGSGRFGGVSTGEPGTWTESPDSSIKRVSAHRIKSGETILLAVTGDVELAYDLEVTPAGFVIIPPVGQVYVDNLTIDQLGSILWNRLAKSFPRMRDGATQFRLTMALK